MTLIELGFFLLMIGCGIAASIYAGAQWGILGYVTGFPAGFLALPGFFWIMGYVEGRIRGRRRAGD